MKTFYGNSIREGYAEGEVIVAKSLCFLGGVDPETGMVIEKGHPLEGKSITEKILVLYNTRGSSAQCLPAYAMIKSYKKGPKGIITCAKDTTIGSIAIVAEVPSVRLGKEALDEIKSGDYIKMRAEKGKIEKANYHFVSKPGKGVVEIVSR